MKAFLDTTPQSLSELPSVEDALKAFRAHILNYRKVLNDEGIWLFLSTVGCWGVPQPMYQLVAYDMTVMLFGARMKSRYTERQSFTELGEILEGRIGRETSDPGERAKQLLLLEQLRKSNLSGLRPLRTIKVFFFCWLFYGASFGYAMLHLPKTAA
ncbi:MAG: hypothetical protein KF892_24315 [Rhizobacter sp.]|nr:hypothetical protein [Rhizobacter sp.]